jgi:hypothetical protein
MKKLTSKDHEKLTSKKTEQLAEDKKESKSAAQCCAKISKIIAGCHD